MKEGKNMCNDNGYLYTVCVCGSKVSGSLVVTVHAKVPLSAKLSKLSSTPFLFIDYFHFLSSLFLCWSFHLFTLLHPPASGRYKACGGSSVHPVTTPMAFWVVWQARAGQLVWQKFSFPLSLSLFIHLKASPLPL